MDPKVKNLIKFFLQVGAGVGGLLYFILKVWGESDWIRITGAITLAVAAWRAALSIYRRMILPAKAPLAYGKWAVVTGTKSPVRLYTLLMGVRCRVDFWHWKRFCGILSIKRNVYLSNFSD